MSGKKTLTTSDLRKALQPILDALTRLETVSNDDHQLIQDLSTKLDSFVIASEEAANGTKKSSGKKKTTKAKKNPAKKTVRRSKKTVDDEKGVVESDDEDAEEKSSGSKSKGKKISVKRASSKKKGKTRNINKMEFFRKMIQEDPTFFDEWVKDEREEFESENEDEWSELTEEARRTALAKLLYEVMKTDHDKALQSKKSEYIEAQKSANMVIEETEE